MGTRPWQPRLKNLFQLLQAPQGLHDNRAMPQASDGTHTQEVAQLSAVGVQLQVAKAWCADGWKGVDPGCQNHLNIEVHVTSVT